MDDTVRNKYQIQCKKVGIFISPSKYSCLFVSLITIRVLRKVCNLCDFQPSHRLCVGEFACMYSGVCVCVCVCV